jgi:hypothetical protein
VLQVFPVGSLDVNTTLPPGHSVVEPLAEIVGVVGDELVVIVIPAEVAEHPPELTVTV